MSAYADRDAVVADAEALSALARETWLDTFGSFFNDDDAAAHVGKYYGVSQQAGEIANAGYHHRLAFDGARLIGYCRSGVYTLPAEVGGERALELHRLYVGSDTKGSGAAQRLIADAVEWAARQGARGMYLSVYDANPRAKAFYRKHDFTDFSEHVFMVGLTPCRMLILRRAL